MFFDIAKSEYKGLTLGERDFHAKMSTDLLPESVNSFLDDFETSLCLPILVVIVLCTAQFVFNHALGIGYTIYQSVKKPATGEEDEEQDKTDIVGKLKGLMSSVYALRAPRNST